MLDEREGPVDPPRSAVRPSIASRCWKRSAIVAAGPIANLLLAVLLYAGAYWIGMDEPKAVLGCTLARERCGRAPVCGPATGCRPFERRKDWTEVRSMTDLRLARDAGACCANEALHLRVSDAQGQHERSVLLLDSTDRRPRPRCAD